jgi:hypothetical protein
MDRLDNQASSLDQNIATKTNVSFSKRKNFIVRRLARK